METGQKLIVSLQKGDSTVAVKSTEFTSGTGVTTTFSMTSIQTTSNGAYIVNATYGQYGAILSDAFTVRSRFDIVFKVY